jgi:hypothetical protein
MPYAPCHLPFTISDCFLLPSSLSHRLSSGVVAEGPSLLLRTVFKRNNY